MAGWVMSALDGAGGVHDDRVVYTAPTPADVAEFGNDAGVDHVWVVDPRDLVTVHGRSDDGGWSVVAADLDEETAEEMHLWFELIEHHGAPPEQGDRIIDDHPLDRIATPGDERITEDRAVRLVVDRIRARGLDHPTEGLVADRFAAGWSVYAPVEIDESDPMAFLDIPVGRSVFLVSDSGRVKETPTSIPPPMAERMFTAEEAFVRRPLAGEDHMAELWAEIQRLESESDGPTVDSFTVETPDEAVAQRASALLQPIVQRLALLGPARWDRMTAVFSFTAGAEIARLGFAHGTRVVQAPVPEQIAVLVRRQRHLASRMPAGPWWRLLVTVDVGTGTGARLATEYDYGDEPFPDEDLHAPERYRDDLIAHPRPDVPRWLAAHIAGATDAASTVDAIPSTVDEPTAPDASVTGAPTAPSGRSASTPPMAVPRLNTNIGRRHLFADPHVITFGRTSIALDEAEWVAYSSTHVAQKRLLFPTFYENTWEFRVGRYPFPGGNRVVVDFYKGGRQAVTPPEWTFLVDLVRTHLEPRLLDDLIARVRRGETVTVGGNLRVNREGVSCPSPRFSLPWSAVGPVHFDNGRTWIHRLGDAKPIVNVPLGLPNGSLVPDLLAAFTS